MAEQNITVIVSSVIFFADNPLSYSSVRSKFSPNERVDQTIKTIESIRKYLPFAKIVLVEMGLQKNIPVRLLQSVDEYLYTGNNLLVKAASKGKYKGLGEALGLLSASLKISKHEDLYIKISGRYLLNDNFNLNYWKSNGFHFKYYGKSVSTRLYAFSGDNLSKWRRALFLSLFKLKKGMSIEEVLPLYINQTLINPVNILGISGLVAPTGENISE